MQSRAIDLENFFALHPLNFLLFYGDYEFINTIYLDDGSPLVDLSMELFNQSTNQTVKFEQPTDLSASATNCHFFFSVEGNFTLEQAPEGWDVHVERSKSDTGDNFYFLKQERYDLERKPASGSPNKIVLVLKNFRADPEGGTRTIRAEMFYGPLLKNQDNQPFQDNYGQYYSYGNTIFITNNRGGKKTLPLQVGFAKGNAVLNDGGTGNSLELVIANKNWPASNLPLSTDSEFVISFEMGDTAKEGAVATDNQIKGISITTSSDKWNVPPGTNRTEWPVTPKSGTTQLASDEVIKLNIVNLVTNHSSGSGYLYVRYKNIPNYPDGQFVVAIEKTPLLYRGAQVGIGTNNPQGKLHVSGTLKATNNNETLKGLSVFPTFDNNSKTGVTHLGLEVTGTTATTGIETKEVMRLVRHGSQNNKNANSVGFKVGAFELGRDGKTQLDITLAGHPGGNNEWGYQPDVTVMSLLADGNVGIGITTPSEKLHVGGNAIVSGKLAIGTITPTAIDLAIGDSDTGLKQEADNKLAIYTNGAGRVLIDNSGNVGIGTTTPSEKLHVGGNAIVTGNVGIGTTSPQAKLDVHGDLYIKGQKPIEEREYRRYWGPPDWTIYTDYLYSEWLCIPGGFGGVSNGHILAFQILPESRNGRWIVRCSLQAPSDEFWVVQLLFIRRELVASK